MTIRRSAPPNTIGSTRVDFVKNNFDNAVWLKGYDATLYDAIECPCKQEGTTNLSNCTNCLGLGWVFINPLKTKGIITSVNKDTKYKYWSPEFKGTVAVTLRDTERLSFMDKIVLDNEVSTMSEVRPVRETAGQKFIFTSYPVDKINSIFIFNGANNPLLHISSSDYNIKTENNYVVELSDNISFPVDFNGVVTIDYDHKVQYNVVDIPHDIRSSTQVALTGKNEKQKLPIQAIAQRSHYVTGDSPKYDGTGTQDNSYL